MVTLLGGVTAAVPLSPVEHHAEHLLANVEKVTPIGKVELTKERL